MNIEKNKNGKKEVKLSNFLKELGFKSVKEFSENTQVARDTLHNWARDKPRLLEVVIKGVLYEKQVNNYKHLQTLNNLTH